MRSDTTAARGPLHSDLIYFKWVLEMAMKYLVIITQILSGSISQFLVQWPLPDSIIHSAAEIEK